MPKRFELCKVNYRFLQAAAVGLLLAFSVVISGCEQRRGSLETLDGTRLGVCVAVDRENELVSRFVVSYLREELDDMEIVGLSQSEIGLLSRDSFSFDEDSSHLWKHLNKTFDLDYLLAVKVDVEDINTEAQVVVGTEKSQFRTKMNAAVKFSYAVYSTETGEEILSGMEVGESKEVLDLRLGSETSRLGLRIAKKEDLVMEAVRDAIQKSGWL